VDDDGVPSREVKLVESGVVKAMLSGRTPVSGITRSTGSRRAFGTAPSNLIVTSTRSSTAPELRAQLLRLAKQRGIEYGLVVRRAGFGGMNSFMQMAMSFASGDSAPATSLVEVYKVFADGHEELVRGAELSGVTAASFKDILAVGDTPTVRSDMFLPPIVSVFALGLSGVGADPGGLSVVSYAVPSLLFDDLTVKKANGPFPSLPAAPSPLRDGAKPAAP
jgi:TldD protein